MFFLNHWKALLAWLRFDIRLHCIVLWPSAHCCAVSLLAHWRQWAFPPQSKTLTFIYRLCSFFATDGQNASSVTDREVSANPVPLQRTKPVNLAPLVPREPPPRLALMPRPASRQERHFDSDAGKFDDTRQRPDCASAANGESGVNVSRVQSFQSRRQPPKGKTKPVFMWRNFRQSYLFIFNWQQYISSRFYGNLTKGNTKGCRVK